MTSLRSLCSALAIASASALLAGSAAAAMPVAAPSTSRAAARYAVTPDVFSAKARRGLIYVADYSNQEIHIYPLAGTNQKEIGHISGVPIVEYLNVDRWHNLYVVEFSAGKVVVFPRGATQPSRTLSVEPSGSFPNAVAISHAGEVAVGQFQTNGINFYHRGATTPFNIVKPPASFGSAGFCAYDAAGNLYVIGSAASHASHIGEIVGGGKGNTVTDFGVNTGITNAKGIQVDTQGNVAVVGDSGTLNVYAPASNTLLSTAQLNDPPNGGPNPNGGFSLLKSGTDLYVASAILNQQNEGLALEYAYPAGGAILNTIAVQVPPSGSETAVTGVAVDPPERP
jgi:sugar lactone lactonase YvrE